MYKITKEWCRDRYRFLIYRKHSTFLWFWKWKVQSELVKAPCADYGSHFSHPVEYVSVEEAAKGIIEWSKNHVV